MSTSKVESALVQAFMDTSLFAADKVQQANAKFLPPTGEPWAAFWFMPNLRSVATLGNGGDDELTGIVQIDLNFPQDAGRAAASTAADTLENAFTAGKRFAYSGQEVTVLACGRSQGRNVNGCFRVPVTISFRAMLPRNPVVLATTWETATWETMTW